MALFLPGDEPRRRRPAFPGKDGGRKENFSEAQGPEDLQNPSHLRQRDSFVISLTLGYQPMSDAGERLAQKRTSRFGGI
ncbi:MAG: hypothetical protein DMG25_02005 [Acidobacteria bacterium]|nr:MAG: hypothetical protein DMG25_02005 [Acidobacteriota bacterium]PYV20322.1 MAG: hypothetical protein DMG27_23375 [Acidobacteriota bacterium]